MQSRALSQLPKPVRDDLRRLGELLRDARARRGFTQADLAQRLHISPTTVRAVEQGYPAAAIGIVTSLLWIVGIGPLSATVASRSPESALTVRSKKRVRTQKSLDDF